MSTLITNTVNESSDKDGKIVNSSAVEGDKDFELHEESDSGTSRRLTVKKTDCKASMHVKRRKDEFDMRWWKLIGVFELQENEYALYEDRKKWVPIYMKDTFLAGLSTAQRDDSLNSFFDRYVHKRSSAKEFVKQYGTVLQNRYEAEAVADFDTCHKQTALKSPSPYEKQSEVLGVVGCCPKRERDDGPVTVYKVEEYEKNDKFMVTWDETKSEVWCSCLLYEYKGILCRHSMIVLQMCGVPSVPNRYILKRWTKDAKNNRSMNDRSEGNERVELYNDLCKHAIRLSEEGSLSEKSYAIALHENITSVSAKTTKRKGVSKKRKLNLMEPPHDGYYVNQQSIHGPFGFSATKFRIQHAGSHNRYSYSRYTKALSECEDMGGGHWKSRSKKKKSSREEDDLSQLWVCEEIDLFTPRIRYFDFPKTRMPSHIKTYDGSEDPEDHLKIFQAATKTERWAMPTWCHMFNSTLTGNARVWFYDLPTESIAFMENYLQQKKCIKDPIELHNIKQRDGKST
nr:protein FAR-RED impaired response 1 [Tanacetum cinerariifolium]